MCGERGVHGRHLKGGGLKGAEGQRGVAGAHGLFPAPRQGGHAESAGHVGNREHTRTLDDLHGVGVHRLRGCLESVQQPVAGVIVVVEPAVGAVQLGGHVAAGCIEACVGREALFERGGQSNRLERRARLEARHHRHNDFCLALGRLASPALARGDGQHLPGAGLDHGDRGGNPVAWRQGSIDRLLRDVHGSRLHRRSDAQPAPEQQVGTRLLGGAEHRVLEHRLEHQLAVVGPARDAAAVGRRGELGAQPRSRRSNGLGMSDTPRILHALEDHIAPQGRQPRVGDRVVGRRPLQHARQRGRLGQGDLGQPHSEVALGGRGHTVSPPTEVDGVQVGGEHAVLAQLALRLDGEPGLAQLATQ
ncbi:unannotated protein [freshwater metagenome]|uniref:Unannotated protein n=1 Tax=freshwater metagenome TaxID=449393 RepID=A0A6J7JTP7_9ZZZZ